MVKWTPIALISVLGMVSFSFVALNEANSVIYLWQNSWNPFCDFMSRSVFESGSIGGSDFGVFIGIGAFFAWISAKRNHRNVFNLSVREWNYIWFSCLFIGLFVVQSLKWIISRARPKTLFANEQLSTFIADNYSSIKWAGFMPIDGPRGYAWNSFPSGHTASCAMLLVLSYIFWRRRKWQGAVIFVLVLTLSFFMAIARSMAGMHWLSDSVASFFISWALVHALSFFYLPEK